MKYQEIEGDLITSALEGKFDVIAHGCNCFNSMGAGIAVPMAKTFDCNEMGLEQRRHYGESNKLGQIEFKKHMLNLRDWIFVVNAYTQYQPGANLDYEALTLCLRKINHQFKGNHIGLPLIGCGLGGGVWDKNLLESPETDFYRDKDVKTIIQDELRDMDVTIVHFKE